MDNRYQQKMYRTHFLSKDLDKVDYYKKILKYSE